MQQQVIPHVPIGPVLFSQQAVCRDTKGKIKSHQNLVFETNAAVPLQRRSVGTRAVRKMEVRTLGQWQVPALDVPIMDSLKGLKRMWKGESAQSRI